MTTVNKTTIKNSVLKVITKQNEEEKTDVILHSTVIQKKPIKKTTKRVKKPQKYNKTQLNVFASLERGIVHRDIYAHMFRFTHACNKLKRNMKILDFGCGSGELPELIYRNRLKAEHYMGLDIRKQIIVKNTEKFTKQDWIHFREVDLCNPHLEPDRTDYDMIISFEVAEHIGKENIDYFLTNIVKHMNEKTILLISTPCFNGKAAKNHIINGVVCEFGYQEFKDVLLKYFVIEKHFGTFASQKDYVRHLTKSQLEVYTQLKEYYDVNMLSNIFAPMVPEHSRNVLWVCHKKKIQIKEVSKKIVKSGILAGSTVINIVTCN